MKFRIRLFLWLSALLAAIAFLVLANWLPALIAVFGVPSFEEWAEPGKVHGYDKIRFGLFTLGSFLLLSTTMLFLLGKKLKTSVYSGLFFLLVIVSLIAGSAVSTL